MRNKKRWTAVLAAVLATAFMLQGTVYVGNEDMHNFVYPSIKTGLANKTDQRDSYYFDSAKSFKFKNLSKKKGGWFLNSGMPASYYKKVKGTPYELQVTGKYLSGSYGKNLLKKLKAYRSKNQYSKLIDYDILLGDMSYVCKYGTTEDLYGIGTAFQNFGFDGAQTGVGHYLESVPMMLTIKEMNQLYKKGYLKYSLYYGADKLKDKTINVGDTITNKPSNMPSSDWYGGSCGIIQKWSAYTPEEFNKAKKNKQTYLTWDPTHTGFMHNTPGTEKAYQVQNKGYNFDNVKSGSDVVSIDKKTGKVTGLKKGTAYITVCYYEMMPVIGDPYLIKEYRDLTKIKDSAELDITITKKLSHTKNFNTPIWQSTVKQAVNNFPESKTLVKFYRTYKVTVK
ncbi:MAG: hypothetical protein PUJ25_07385 [Lachnospiraceae bacterium]|nr:hypothetical protein [Lachnospiraceae bacterium]MDD7665396.1 hypothetical protein [Lachnospiraceae bacterium]MDY4165715.1 hypothetical protein [Lachnospiraceae bacterium]